MTIRDIRNLPSNLDKQISRDFNNLIRKIHRTLSTKKHSPVYTGFFASSWKAQGTPVRPKDPIEKFSPWNSIKKQATAEFLKNKFANKANKSTGYYNVKPFIKPRFPVDRAFNYTRTVYIGNQAKYAAYALEGGKLQLFIQGSLGKMIKETMTDKGKIFIGGSTTFNNSPRSTTTQPDPTVKYTEF
tara:strand:- start:596 stop:1153 length:558 start_codon:yes stop_codon:yes gene_type:complete